MKSNVEINEAIKADNYKVFALVSNYLNAAPDYVKQEEIEEIVSFGVTEEHAFRLIIASAFGLDIEDSVIDKQLYQHYFNDMITRLDPAKYRSNPYYRNIKIPTIKVGSSELKYERYKPYEGFVWNDIIRLDNGRQIPQLGFFEEEFDYPAVFEHDRIWMTITPNEIETMQEPIAEANGHVLVFGLGLGYYAYMVSEKSNVDSVTIVESNKDVIRLFEQYILPQFQFTSKIKIVHNDAFAYAEQNLAQASYHYIFTDLWHDVSDGIDMYLKMKAFESLSPQSTFSYWIEKSMLCYL